MVVKLKDINYIETGEVGWQNIIDNFAALKTAVEALQNTVLLRDGSVKMTGDLWLDDTTYFEHGAGSFYGVEGLYDLTGDTTLNIFMNELVLMGLSGAVKIMSSNLDLGGNAISEVSALTGNANLVINSKVPGTNNIFMNAAAITASGELNVNGAFEPRSDPTDPAHSGDRLYNDNRRLEHALTKVSTTTVPFNATGQTTLYTVPAGKTFLPAMAIIRAGADAGTTDVTFGRVGALTDWLGTIQLDNLDAAGDQVKVELTNTNPPTKSKTYAAAVVFQINVTVANGGATNYVDLFGYLV